MLWIPGGGGGEGVDTTPHVFNLHFTDNYRVLCEFQHLEISFVQYLCKTVFLINETGQNKKIEYVSIKNRKEENAKNLLECPFKNRIWCRGFTYAFDVT